MLETQIQKILLEVEENVSFWPGLVILVTWISSRKYFLRLFCA